MKLIVTTEMKPRSLKIQARNFIDNKNRKCKMEIFDACLNKKRFEKTTTDRS